METSQSLFGFPQIGIDSVTDSTLTFEEITKELEEYLLEESDNTESTDGIFDLRTTLSEQIQDVFDKLLDSNSNKKRLLKGLSIIFALLLNTKVDTT